MSLQDRLDALKAQLASRNSPEAQATMRRATEALLASGMAQRAIRTGDRAPAFMLPDVNGAMVRSDELLSRGPLVVSFYRGVWCPYCNLELQALQETLEEIRARGAELVVLSPQSAANSRRSTRIAGLEFPMLIDKANAVAAAFGLRFKLPDDLIALYKGFGNDLALANGDDSWTLPMPARFVIDPVGVVRYAEVNPDYSVRPEPRDLLPVLDDINWHCAGNPDGPVRRVT
ncbi:MAG: peroxiredoxin-like family protein [Ramlibacter sp.]|nr:peroxiredoxin-like family protein [Ramlibacter sp.]